MPQSQQLSLFQRSCLIAVLEGRQHVSAIALNREIAEANLQDSPPSEAKGAELLEQLLWAAFEHGRRSAGVPAVVPAEDGPEPAAMAQAQAGPQKRGVTFGKMERGAVRGDDSEARFQLDGREAGYISAIYGVTPGTSSDLRITAYEVSFWPWTGLTSDDDRTFKVDREKAHVRSYLAAAKRYVREKLLGMPLGSS